jgi:hypothetical protein
MIKNTAIALALLAVSSTAFAQDKKVTVADFVGTWNIEMMSHQIALVVEPAEGNKVTATMLMPMGAPEVLLKGELTDRTLTLVGVKPEGAAAPAAPAATEHGPAQAANASAPKPIVITMQEDGTIVGEMMTNRGPAKWTGEKLKAKKKS